MDTEIQELQGKIYDYELEVNNLKEQRDSYKKFIVASIQYLSNEGLMELAKNEWIYSIEVNGKSIKPNGLEFVNSRNGLSKPLFLRENWLYTI